MKEPICKGVFVETLTGFDQGLLPSDKAQHMLHIFLARAGVQGVVVNGDTGEFPSLSLAERKHLQDIALFDGTALKILVNITATNLGDTLDLANHITTLSQTAPKGKFTSLVVFPPYFYPTREDGLRAYFESLLRKVDAPIILANNPLVCTGNKLTPSLLSLANEFSQIAGVQDVSRNIDSFREMREQVPDVSMYIAHEPLILESLRLGATGIISSIANIFPELIAEMFNMSQKGAWDDLVMNQELVTDIFTAVNRQPFHAALKVGVTQRLPDFGLPHVRPPLVNLNFQEIQMFLAELAPFLKIYQKEKAGDKKTPEVKTAI